MDFLASVLVLTVALGLFIHSAEFPPALIPGSDPALYAFSTAVLAGQPGLGDGAVDASVLSGSNFCVRITNSTHVFFDGCQDFSCPNPRTVDRYAACLETLCTVSVRGCP